MRYLISVKISHVHVLRYLMIYCISYISVNDEGIRRSNYLLDIFAFLYN